MKKTIKTIWNTISIFTIFLVLVSGVGGTIRFSRKVPEKTSVSNKVVAPVDYHLEEDIAATLDKAHIEANNFASKEVDAWVDEILLRANDDFLNDYFNFINVKKRELTILYHSVAYFFVEDSLSPEEAALKELEEEISRKVIMPEVSQARIKNITDQTIEVYLSVLDSELIKLQEAHEIPTPEWNRYISDICGITIQAENKEYPIAFKTMVVSGVTLTGITVTPIVSNIARKVSMKIAEKNAVKAGIKIAEKTAVKTSTKAIGKGAGTFAKAIPYIGWGITAAICIWDIADYSKTAREGKLLVRSSLEEYLKEIKTELLGSSEDSIMGSIQIWENNLKRNIIRNKPEE